MVTSRASWGRLKIFVSSVRFTPCPPNSQQNKALFGPEDRGLNCQVAHRWQSATPPPRHPAAPLTPSRRRSVAVEWRSGFVAWYRGLRPPPAELDGVGGMGGLSLVWRSGNGRAERARNFHRKVRHTRLLRSVRPSHPPDQSGFEDRREAQGPNPEKFLCGMSSRPVKPRRESAELVARTPRPDSQA